MIMKTCTKCKQTKDITEFSYKNRTPPGISGYDTICKACNREYARERAKRIVKSEPITEGTRICITCNQEKPVTEFGIDRRLKSGRISRCKSCIAEYTREYKKKHQKEIKEYNRVYNNELTEKYCIVCGCKYTARRTDTIYCPDCHKYKRSIPELQFIKLLEKYKIKYQQEEFYLCGLNYDFYLPDYNLIVEISPTYTHSINPTGYISHGKPKDYHVNKIKIANDAGFICVNLWDWIQPEVFIKLLIQTQGKLTIIKREPKEHIIDNGRWILWDDGQDIEGL